MPWTEKDYPDSWKNFDPETRRKAIDIANAMIKEGMKKAKLYLLLRSKRRNG